MAHHNTVFAQMLKFIPTCLSRQRHEFESLANQHHSGRRLRKMTRWAQFVAMATAQLSARTCLQQAGQPSGCGQQPHGRSPKALPPGHECCEPVFPVQGQRLSILPVVRSTVRETTCLPEQTGRQAFVALTEGKTDDLSAARALAVCRICCIVLPVYFLYLWLERCRIFFLTTARKVCFCRLI